MRLQRVAGPLFNLDDDTCSSTREGSQVLPRPSRRMAAVVILLGLVSLIWPRVLGMGDVKLALLVLAGLDGSAIRALMLGSVLAVLAGLGVIARFGLSAGRRTLPLAAFIAAGSLLALLT